MKKMVSIDDLYSREEIALEINNQDKLFNIYEYCLQDNESDDRKSCAIGMITPKQSFTCFSMNYHDTTVECVLFALYDDYNDTYNSTDGDWHKMVYEYNDICILYLYSRELSYFYILVYLPEQINKYQYSKLFELYDSIEKINDYLKSKGGKEIEFTCGYRVNNNFELLSLEDAIIFMGDKLTLVNERDEMEIVSKEEQRSRSFIKRRKKVSDYAKGFNN